MYDEWAKCASDKGINPLKISSIISAFFHGHSCFPVSYLKTEEIHFIVWSHQLHGNLHSFTSRCGKLIILSPVQKSTRDRRADTFMLEYFYVLLPQENRVLLDEQSLFVQFNNLTDLNFSTLHKRLY